MQVYALSKQTVHRWQWGDPLLRHLTERVLRLVDLSGGRALDIGCGTGRLAIALARRGFQVDALDVEGSVVEQGRELAERCGARLNWFVADFARPDARFGDGSYDLVVCSEVLEHIGPWRDVVDNIRRVLKPGGSLVLTVPNDPKQFSVLDTYGDHLRRYRWADLESGLEGFTVDTAFTIGFPLTRAIHWAYTRLLVPFVFREHSPERMWEGRSAYRAVGAGILYGLLRVDDLFNGLRRGTTWIVRARRTER